MSGSRGLLSGIPSWLGLEQAMTGKLYRIRMERPSILAHLQIVDVFLNPLLLWVGTHLAVPSSDKDDCKVGALAAGVKILLHVGTGQCEGEVGKAAGSGVRAIWGGRCGGAEGGCNEDDGEGCSCGDLHGT